jgi:hypothetical protein
VPVIHITPGLTDGNLWRTMAEKQQAAFLVELRRKASNTEREEMFPTTLDSDGLLYVLHRFYTDEANRAIPITYALRVVTLRSNGVAPAVVMEFIEALRREAK